MYADVCSVRLKLTDRGADSPRDDAGREEAGARGDAVGGAGSRLD